MPLYYDNTVSPFYSETERNWTSPQDWTIEDVNGLILHVRGNPAQVRPDRSRQLQPQRRRRRYLGHRRPVPLRLQDPHRRRHDHRLRRQQRLRHQPLGQGRRHDPRQQRAGVRQRDGRRAPAATAAASPSSGGSWRTRPSRVVEHAQSAGRCADLGQTRTRRATPSRATTPATAASPGSSRAPRRRSP